MHAAGHSALGESRAVSQGLHSVAPEDESGVAASGATPTAGGAAPCLGRSGGVSLAVLVVGVGLFWAVPSVGLLLMVVASMSLAMPWNPPKIPDDRR